MLQKKLLAFTIVLNKYYLLINSNSKIEFSSQHPPQQYILTSGIALFVSEKSDLLVSSNEEDYFTMIISILFKIPEMTISQFIFVCQYSRIVTGF